MKKFVTSLAVAALLATGTLASAGAMAQTALPTGAPAAVPSAAPETRVNQVDQRLDNQQQRIDNGVKEGQINATQEMRDQKTDAKVSQEISADQAKHGGKITKAEQVKMNKQLNHNSKRIHRQRAKGAAVTPAPAMAPAAQ